MSNEFSQRLIDQNKKAALLVLSFLKNLEQLKDLSFKPVCCLQLDLLLWMVEAQEVIKRKGRRNNELSTGFHLS